MMKWFTDYFQYPADSLLLAGDYNPLFVLLSLAIAIFTSTVAMQLATTARKCTESKDRVLLLVGSSIAMGGGVWAMHFVGMLAFQLCTTVDYEPLVTIASILPSMAACGVAISLLGRTRIATAQLLFGGLLMAAGIGTMHYSGMAAMVMAPQLKYDARLFMLSILVAVVLAIIALWARFRLQHYRHIKVQHLNLLSGTFMGLAIAGMHYVGMAAARFVAPADFVQAEAVPVSTTLALVVTFITISLTTLAFTLGGMLRHKSAAIEARSEVAKQQHLLLHMPVALLVVNSNGLVMFANFSAEKLLQVSPSDLIGRNITTLVPEQKYSAFYTLLKSNQGSADFITLPPSDVMICDYFGFEIPVNMTVEPVIDTDDELCAIYLQCTKEKIADHKKIELLTGRLEQLDNSAENFFVQISNDISEPLEDILVISNELANLRLGEGYSKIIRKLHNHSIEIHEIVRNSIDLAKINSGKEIFVNSKFTIKSLMDDIRSSMYRFDSEFLIEIHHDEECEVVSIFNDYDMLRRVVLNLIQISRKDSFGRVELSVKFSSVRDGFIFIVRNIFSSSSYVLNDSVNGCNNEIILGFSALKLNLCQRMIENMSGLVLVNNMIGGEFNYQFSIPFEN